MKTGDELCAASEKKRSHFDEQEDITTFDEQEENKCKLQSLVHDHSAFILVDKHAHVHVHKYTPQQSLF